MLGVPVTAAASTLTARIAERVVGASCRSVRRGLLALVLVLFTATTSSGAAGAALAQGTPTPDRAGTVWLCRPGMQRDPCRSSLDTSVFTSPGAVSSCSNVFGRNCRVARLMPAPRNGSRFDCFYVYPTVSEQPTANADLKIDPAETAVAVAQAAWFSQVCDVWAPMYRQVTLAEILGPNPVPAGAQAIAYASLLAAWRDYLANFNHERPIVLIGHSQGAALLIKLLRRVIEPDAVLRKRLVSAILLGGNVQVPRGKLVGGSFRSVPVCSRTGQVGCVIAYSAFPSEPSPDSLFGRPGQGVSRYSGQLRSRGLDVACVNPASIAGGKGILVPYFPSAGSLSAGGMRWLLPPYPPTPWLSFANRWTATCRSAGGATWLQVSPTRAWPSKPDVLTKLGSDPRWGYHGIDVNLALGNLVQAVRAQQARYR
jgi:Protein of unknown function (DUF3089)